MKKSLIIIILAAILITFAGCSPERPSNKIQEKEKSATSGSSIEQQVIYNKKISRDQPVTGVIVTINQGLMGDPVLRLETAENIKRIVEIDSELENHKDVSILTMPVDVEIKYILKNGQTIRRIFKRIRPVDKYFADIFNTLEAKKQMIPIFKINPDQVTSVKFTSFSNQFVWESVDKRVIKESIANIIKHYEETNYYGDQRSWVTIADVSFYTNKKLVAGGIVLRGEPQWDNLFSRNKNLKRIKTDPEDVKSVILTEYGTGKSVTVKDVDTIQNILNTYLDGAGSNSKITVDIVLKTENSQGGHVHGSYDLGSMPDFISSLFSKRAD